MSAFKEFEAEDKLENIASVIAEAMWTDSAGTITSFFTGSVQDSNTGKYYYDVHTTSDQTTDVQFAVTYGHTLGSGSESGTTIGKTNPTKAVYAQLRQVLLPAQTTRFNFHGDSGTDYYSDDVFAVVINRERYREKMDPGNWELHLQSGSGVDGNTISLIDSSGATSNPTVGESKREFWVVSGSLANGIYTTASSTATTTNSGSYGLFYPETGIILLNQHTLASGSATVFDNTAFIEPVGTSADTNDLNHRKLFNSIKSGSSFQARREEVRRSSFYFCRVPFDEYNHSQNPSYVSGDNAELVNSFFVTEPTTYITTVGLYNDNNELLAVAKLSQPFKKDQTTEALIKVKLEF